MIKQFKLKPEIIETIDDLKFKTLTEIQLKTIPPQLKNHNLIGVSATGSGKTLAFLIPAINKIEENQNVQLLIITPTRELARQIESQVNLFKKSIPWLKSQLLISGDYIKQIKNIQHNKPQIIISTVTKLKDAIENKEIDFSNLKTLILDEADMLMDLGFFSQILNLMKEIDNPNLQKTAWSATLHEMLAITLSKVFKDCQIIQIGKSIYENDKIKHQIIESRGTKIETLDGIIKQINPYLCLIFANRNIEVEQIYRHLKETRNDVTILHGKLESRERKINFKKIKNLEFKYVVVSDLGSRGLDIDGCSHVINYNLPKDSEWYVHRSGRAGRGKYDGESIVIYDPKDQAKLDSLQKKGINFEWLTLKNDKLISKAPRRQQRTFKYPVNPAIEKLKATKNKKVKPNYKKKQAREIARLKQKAKRNHIEQSMKEARIKKYKIDSIKKKNNL